MNSNKKKQLLIVFVIILYLVPLLYAPHIYLFLCPLLLVLLYYSNLDDKALSVFKNFLILGSLWGMVIYTLSIPRFVKPNDDYINYYNNYLDFYNGNMDGLLSFGGGLEIGLPVLNLAIFYLVGEPKPYLVELCHLLLHALLFWICLVKISSYYKFSQKEQCILFGLSFMMYKMPQVFHLLRQGYSSYFIILAIFSGQRLKYIYIILGSIFHLTAPLIFFVTKKIHLLRFNSKQTIIVSVVFFVFTMFIFNGLSSINTVFDSSLTKKINYLVFASNSNDSVVKSIISSFSYVVYFIPLIILWLCNGFRKSDTYIFNILILLLVFSPIPGFSNRVLMPYLSILMGYMFARVIIDRKYSLGSILYCFLYIQLNLSWLLISSQFYHNFSLISSYPFGYLSILDEIFYGIEKYELINLLKG